MSATSEAVTEGLTWPYEADDGDHFETSEEALRDVAFLLRRAAQQRQLTVDTLKVYDPYYCNGRAKRLLKSLGFRRVIHRCRDYQDIANDDVPAFHVLFTNPPYSSDHKKRLLDFILQRQRLRLEAKELTEPFLLLLPSWTVGKAFFRHFLSSLAKLKAKTGEEQAAEVFYLCRRGAKGRPEKYGFHHVEGAGMARCPFFGLWICGGFGEATERVAAAARRRKAEGFWDDQWYGCRPYEALTDGRMAVRWEDGTQSDLKANELRGGLLLFRDLSQLEKAKLLRSAEELKKRQELNPKQKLRLERIREALRRKRQAMPRQRKDTRHYVRALSEQSCRG